MSRRSFIVGLLWVGLLLGSPRVALGAEGLLFHVPFDEDTTPAHANGMVEPAYSNKVEIKPGKLGNAVSVTRRASQLIYDGPGNAYTAAGTASFFWRADEDPAGAAPVIIDLSPFERINYNRFMRLSYGGGKFSVFFTAGHRGTRGPASKPIAVKEGQWHHLAMAWDQTRGLAVYLDGEKILEAELGWVYDGHFNQIALGQTARADFRPGQAPFSQSFDELRVYDRWVDDAAIEALSQGREPQLGRLDPAPLLELRRQTWRWDNGAGAELPELKLGEGGLALHQAGVKTAKDVGRSNWRAFDGERARRWPGGAGYADAGETLRVTMDGAQRFDVVQIYGFGRIGVATGADQPDLLALDMGDLGYHRLLLPQPVTVDQLVVSRTPVIDDQGHIRRSGGVHQLILLERRAYEAPQGQAWQKLPLAPAAEQDRELPALAQVRRTFYSADQQTLIAGGGSAGAVSRVAFPAMRAVHIVGPAAEQRRGLGAMALDLAVTRGAPAILRVEITDPLTPERFLLAADVNLSGTSGSGPLRLLLDHRDLVLPPGVAPRINLTFSTDVEVDLSNSSINYRWLSIAEALKQHLPDQMARAKDVFQEISEARSWSQYRGLHAVRMHRRIVEELRSLDPQNPTLISYWHWINPSLQKAIIEPPAVPQGVPAWAVYLDASIEKLKQVPYWWIDNRENQFGEFGANDGINDDTCLVQDWWAMHLMRGPDQKLFESLKRVAERSWAVGMNRSGLGRVTDALHHYEWGINAQCHMAMMDYGNPVYIARLMATARHYKDLMGVNPAGHLHFYDDRYGHGGSPDEPGKFIARIDKSGTRRDKGYNALALHPAILLGWYNGNEYCTQVTRDWTDAMLAHSIIEERGEKRAFGVDVVWGTDESSAPSPNFGYGFMDLPYALWDLTGDSSYLDYIRMAIDTEVRQYRHPRSTGRVADRYIHASGDHSLKERMVARAQDPAMWQGSLHNDNYYALDTFYLAWQMTGDVAFIDEGVKLTLNDITWALPMLTEGEQSTDRVWTPQRLANRVALGGPAMLRNELYPKIGASWENASGRVAPFVFSQDRQQLQAWVQNLEDQPVTVNMRLWRLDHGEYAIEQGPDRNQDGKIDGTPQRSDATLARFSAVELTIPARTLWLVTLKQTKALEDIRMRPDLAICAEDATYDPASRELSLVVHNIGAKPTGAFALRVSADGKVVLDEKQLASLDHPADLQPKTTVVRVKVDPGAKVVVELDPEGRIAEITEVNNRLELLPETVVRR